MKKNFKYLLEERLKYRLSWKDEYLEYFKHQEITEKTKIEYLFYFIYFFPFNTLRFFQKRKAITTFKKILTEIQILQEELSHINNLNGNRRISE